MLDAESHKESRIPHFRSTAKGKIGAAIEVKLCNSKARVKRIIDEISADVPAYRKRFHPILFIIYDMGFIRNEDTLRKTSRDKTPAQES